MLCELSCVSWSERLSVGDLVVVGALHGLRQDPCWSEELSSLLADSVLFCNALRCEPKQARA